MRSTFAMAIGLVLVVSSSRLGSQTFVREPLPRPPGANVTTITTPGSFSEPGITIDPRDPRHAVGVYQNQAMAAWTSDAGATWTNAEGTAPPHYRVAGDVSVAIDHHGHVFLCYIAFDRSGVTSYWGLGGSRGGIFVRRSFDSGRSWEKDHHVVVEHSETKPNLPWEDMPSITADTREHSPYKGNLYIGWIQFLPDRTVMLFSRSTDEGVTWSAPKEVSTNPGLPRDDTGGLVGFRSAIADDGTLYATWHDGKGIVFTTSRDGGKTFTRSRRVIETAPPYFNIANFSRGNGFPNIAIEPKSHRLYVSWGDYRNGDIDIFVAWSADRGKRWSKPTRVNDDPQHNGKDQFMQWAAVDPSDGSVYVVFYDRRGDSLNARPIVVLARSTNGGRTFTNYAWTDTSFDPRESQFLGDYSGLSALDGKVYGIWAEEAQTAAKVENGRRGRNTVVRIGTAQFPRASPPPRR
ncbi:MAG: exo-alpha-sialidase [bacterium]